MALQAARRPTYVRRVPPFSRRSERMRFTRSSGDGRRRRWTFGISLTVAVAAMAFVIASAFGVTGSPSNFQSADGDMIQAAGTGADWATVDGTCAASALSCTSGDYVHLADASNSTDDSF